jgi:dihydrofolate reductase
MLISTGPATSLVRCYAWRRSRLIDEMEIHVVPVLLGGGARLFDNLDGGPSGYACVALASSSAVAHYTYVRQDTA